VTSAQPDTNSVITHYAFFKNKYPAGSSKLITVEYKNAADPLLAESNWYDVFTNAGGGIVTLKETEYNDTRCSTFTEHFAKMILGNNWNLSRLDTGTGTNTAIDCFGDDYIRFYADRTWKYFVGPYTCDEGNVNSSGTFNNLPYFNGPGFSTIMISEGSMKPRNFVSWGINDLLESRFFGNNKWEYVFTTRWYGNP
jgi:hypothetical protein